MSYSKVVFDAEGGLAEDELSFQNFGSATIPADAASGRMGSGAMASPSGRLSPSVFDGDRAMHEQLGPGNAPGINGSGSGSGSGRTSRLFSVESYSSYFDVDTPTVLERSWRTLYPKDEYIPAVLNNQPDLYGPFWVPTTLVFALFLSSSLSSSIQAYLAGAAYSYDFTALSVAVTVVYIYTLAVPVALWGVIRYWAGVDERSPVDIISVYGYSATVWIFSALLSIPPIPLVRFAFSALAFCLSGFFLLRNIYPILSNAQSKAARVLILAVASLHFIFSVLLWSYFLNAGGAIASPALPGNGTLPPVDAGESLGA